MKFTFNIQKIPRNYLLALLALSFSIVSCTGDYEELNTPQDQIVAENIDANLMAQSFSYAQYHTVSGMSTYIWNTALYADRYAQYFSNIHPAFRSEQYIDAGAHKDRLWSNFYSMVATQIFFVEEFTSENGMAVENAIAKVQRVLAYSRMTDAFGPIIYSEFGSGETTVNFDSQEDIYLDFFSTLDEAVEVLSQNTGGTSIFGSNDQMYEGDITSWLKFANSLRLRLAMHVAYVDPVLAKQEAEKAVNSGVITNNAENGLISTTINSLNGLSRITYHEEWRMSASMYSTLAGYNDPRMQVYFEPRWDGEGYRGLRNGLPVEQTFRNAMTLSYSPIGNKWRPLYSGAWGQGGDNPPMAVITSAEVYFLRAEGALRGWEMGGSPVGLYEDGIRMSLSLETDISTPEIETYIQSNNTPIDINDPWNSPAMTNIPVAYQAGADFETQLERIITQKWIAIFPDGWEAWTERRRTGYPVGYAIIESLNPNLTKFELARRREYPPIEATSNAQGFQSALQLLNGPDEMSTRLWWDAKPINLYPQPAD
jgi:hypothetical protein